MRAVAYIRVSDLSQLEGHSLDAQERLFHELCKSRGWVPGRCYREEGKSAHSDSMAKRPAFRQLLEDAATGQFDVVLVHTLDHWARNLKVLLDSVAILNQHGVGLVSITENLDWSTAEGRLVARTLGSFGEFFSDMLATHVKKGITERARQGLHLGGIPFGYEPCWLRINGERQRRCHPEHPGGVHVHPQEGLAVQELFKRYAAGTTTLSQLAAWLNDAGFRTRNTKRLPDAQGNLSVEPRLFTVASVRGILHNPFYTGKVKHHDQLLPGSHEPLISESLFYTVQVTLKKNSGRSETLHPRPEREYLLKGLIRCAHCGYPLWAQTYKNGHRYYREQYGSRGAGYCVGRSGSMPCDIPDEQMGRIISAIALPDSWQDRLLARLHLEDEVKRVERERKEVEQRLKRLGQVYLDGLKPHEDYRREKRQLEDRLQLLVVPGIDAAQEAGKLLENLPVLWEAADLGERHKILLTMLDGVYVDTVEDKAIVAIRPKPAFQALFQVATTKEGSGVLFYNEKASTLSGSSDEMIPCFWWRRG
ncbi:MAG TPA: recombinase family protein, partial [Dehalococcoidia bacterium]|nr:recombinase family protein [Dehalococcoidia bacterium]